MQAACAAAWLKPRLPERCDILVSPAVRAQETALALDRPFSTSSKVGTDTSAADVIAAAGGPARSDLVVIVGHQPILGRVAAMLLSGREFDWEIAKAALWWFRHSGGNTSLIAVLDPDALTPPAQAPTIR